MRILTKTEEELRNIPDIVCSHSGDGYTLCLRSRLIIQETAKPNTIYSVSLLRDLNGIKGYRLVLNDGIFYSYILETLVKEVYDN